MSGQTVRSASAAGSYGPPMTGRPLQPLARRGMVVLNLTGKLAQPRVNAHFVEPKDVVNGFRDACRDVRQLHRRDLVVMAPADFFQSLTAGEIDAAARRLQALPFDCRVHFCTGPDTHSPVPRDALPRRFLPYAPENRGAGLGH